MSEELLFSSHHLSDVLRAHEQALVDEINSLDPEHILNTSPDELYTYFEEKFRVNVPQIQHGGISVDQQDQTRDGRTRYGEPYKERGTAFRYFVPYEGDSDIFRFKPSTYGFNPPTADIQPNKLGSVDI